MAWIPNFKCLGCGSTCGKWIGKTNVAHCFTCCVSQGEIALTKAETEGLSNREIKDLTSVEEGTVEEILERLHTPGGVDSQNFRIKKATRKGA